MNVLLKKAMNEKIDNKKYHEAKNKKIKTSCERECKTKIEKKEKG